LAKTIVFHIALSALVLCSAAAADDSEPIRLLRWLDSPEPGLTTGRFEPVAGTGLTLPQGQPLHVYFRILPVVELIDGGPNLNKVERNPNTFEEAYWPGYGMNLEIWIRAVQNAYLTFSFGGAVFPGGHEMDRADGYRYKLNEYYPAYLAVGGAFAAPLSYLVGGDQADDLQGIMGTFSFDMGMRYNLGTEMTYTASPTTPGSVDRTGQETDFWHARVGFQGSVHLGLDLRFGPFSLIADVGIRTFGKHVSATHPEKWAQSEAMITYPVRAGVSIRF
jgi:hypothetical protein